MTDERDRVLMVQRPQDALLGGLWGCQWSRLNPTVRSTGGFARGANRGQSASGAAATVEHVFTHRKLTLEIYDITHFEGEITPNWYTNARWLSAHEMGEIARSRLTDKVLSAVGYDTP